MHLTYLNITLFLIQSPMLTYPHFDPRAYECIVQMEASAVCLGAVLEQENNMIAITYTRQSPTFSKQVQCYRKKTL